MPGTERFPQSGGRSTSRRLERAARWRGRARRRRVLGVALAAVTIAFSLASCSSAPKRALKASQILQVDATTMTVHLMLQAALTDDFSGFNFNGYGDGQLTVTVPKGWTVDVTCTNESTAFSHSCAIAEDLPIAPTPAPVAFPGATSPNPGSGLTYRQVATFSFVASRTGTYRIACLVTGHEADGMWDWFIVTPGGSPKVHT